MTALSPRQLVIGAGGTGKTHVLQSWLADADLDVNDASHVIWLSGSPLRSPDELAVKKAIKAGPQLIVVDDLQWFAEAALEVLLDGLDDVALWASRRPWPSNKTMAICNDALTERAAATRVGLLDEDAFARAVATLFGSATASDVIDQLFAATSGSIGLAADCINSSWNGDLTSLAEELIDAVRRRVERCGTEASALVQMLSVAADLDPATAVEALDESIDRNNAQRGSRAGGVLDAEGLLIPLVRAAVSGDLTDSERSRIHDRFAVALTPLHPDAAVEHLVAGSGEVPGATDALVTAAERLQHTDPERALALADQAEQGGLVSDEIILVRAGAAFELGTSEALAHLDRVSSTALPAAAALGYGIDVRDMRWEAALGRPLEGELSAPMRSLAACLWGTEFEVPTPSDPSPQAGVILSMARGLVDLANGDAAQALSELARAADDYDRIRPDTPIGITPHSLGALTAVMIGDISAADSLLTQAIDNVSGGAGEAVTHRLLRSYVRLTDGDYQFALEDVRAGEGENWTQRDRFLLAAIDAALARRSGDTSRLREAWRRADPVLVRQSTSWIFTDFFVELLAAGCKLGELRRVEPVRAGLVAQLVGLPSTGPAPVAARWIELQFALATDNDDDGRLSAASALSASTPGGPRSEARILAGSAWMAIQSKTAVEADMVAAAEQIGAVGDGWEASRILGQAALDQSDPKAARRLLEAARLYAVEPNEDDGGGLVALGLSDREAEVAVLVAEGRTHKEVGAQLYISPKTVEHHVARIRQKLGATSRAELLGIIREAVSSS